MSTALPVMLADVFVDVREDLEKMVRRRVGSIDTAADLTQDIFLKSVKSDVRFADRREARAYLIRMASNLAIDYVRVQGRRAMILNEMSPVADGYDREAESPEAFALARDRVRQIEDVFRGLPKLARDMFVMVRLHGMTHKEAAEKLGVSKSLVDKYIVQALLRCRDTLGGLDKLD